MASQEQIQEILHKLFVKYACSGTKLSINYIQLGKFIQLMHDAGISNQQLTNKQLELIFCSENKHRSNMGFQAFLETFPKILKAKYPALFQRNPGQAFSKLLTEHLIPLYNAWQEESKTMEMDFRGLDQESRLIFNASYSGLRELHQLYFPWELKHNIDIDSVLNRSQRAFSNFIREFDICPTLLNKAQVSKLWNDLVMMLDGDSDIAMTLLPSPNHDQGTCLTLGKFLLIVYSIGVIGYRDDPNIGESPISEKLLILLERLELSKGFQGLSNQSTRISLLPPQHIIHRVLYPESENIEEFSIATDNENNQDNNDETLGLHLQPETFEKLEEKIDKIMQIFQAYCSFGEPMNTTRMSGSKFIKLLRDAGILRDQRRDPNSSTMSRASSRASDRGIQQQDIDILFTSIVQKGHSQGRIDFSKFLQLLEQLATRIYPQQELDEAFINLIDNNIINIQGQFNEERGVQSGYIKDLMELLTNPEIIEALSLVHRSIIYFYRYYTNNQGLMTFDNFMKFCKDFSIFPDLLPKSKLLRFFFTLASIHSQTEQPEMSVSRSTISETSRMGRQDGQSIDEHLFVEGLALISAEVLYKDPQPTPLQRICYLMERLSQSDGPSIVFKGFGHNRAAAGESQDMLYCLRDKYPEIFMHEGDRKLNFGDILACVPFQIDEEDNIE